MKMYQVISIPLALTVFALAACGDEAGVKKRPENLSDASTNKISTGGYWWTFKSKDPNTTVDPLTSQTVAMKMSAVDATGAKVTGPSGTGGVACISYKVDAAPLWEQTGWDATTKAPKGTYTAQNDAGGVGYPTAGLGFSFLDKNAVFDATVGGKWKGIKFTAKSTSGPTKVSMQFPTPDTDVHTPVDAAGWNTTCTCTGKNTYAAGKVFCLPENGATEATGPLNSCYAYVQKTFDFTTEWQTFEVLYSELDPATNPSSAADGAATDKWATPFKYTPEKALKVIWAAPQPAAGLPPAVGQYCIGSVDFIPTEVAATP